MSTESIQLAPAAGAGIGKLLAERILAEPTFIDAMVAAIMNGLKATRSFWVKGPGGSELVTEADFKVQLHAFALVLAHMEGEPIKRIIHQHLGAGATVDPLSALRESPELRAAARRELEKAEWHESGRRGNGKHAKQTEAVEVD